MSSKKQSLEQAQSSLNIGTATPGDARAFLDLNVPTTNVDTVIQAKIYGSAGNDITISFVSGGPATGTLDESAYPDIVYHFSDGVTTVANFEADVAASTYLLVKTPGTGANLIDDPTDLLAPTNLAGGVDGVLLTQSHAGLLRPSRYLITAVVTSAPSDLYVYARAAIGSADNTNDRWGLYNDMFGRVVAGKLGTTLAVGTHHFVLENIGIFSELWFTKSAGAIDVYVHPIAHGNYGS